MADESAELAAPVRFRDVAIVGGGCYGTFYAGQMLRARERGKAEFRRLLIVDRDPGCQFAREIGSADDHQLIVSDWDEFFDQFLDRPADDSAAADTIVPSPLMPHLMYRWLLRRAQARWPGRRVWQAPLDDPLGTPYDTAAPDGTRYVSFADWLCPVHCIEPGICPLIRAPRTWEMGEAVERLVERRNRSSPTAGPALFTCRHRVFGVGMFDAAEVRAGDDMVQEAGSAGTAVDIVVGTVSACHGAVSLLSLGTE
ncbi:MAG TPA: hypothetical protein VFL95_06390 [Gemmatimonadales bacterium]|nr:hypothetical protein [Gemmatimonadales bacterium]